jgi:hypothetical protein
MTLSIKVISGQGIISGRTALEPAAARVIVHEFERYGLNARSYPSGSARVASNG